MIIIISPFVLLAIAAIVAVSSGITAGTVITLTLIVCVSLVLSLAICAVMARFSAPKVYRAEPPRQVVWARPVSHPDAASTAISANPPTLSIELPKTYKRMIGRRVVEYDALTHQPVDGTPMITMDHRRITDNG